MFHGKNVKLQPAVHKQLSHCPLKNQMATFVFSSVDFVGRDLGMIDTLSEESKWISRRLAVLEFKSETEKAREGQSVNSDEKSPVYFL